jgi:hypothetical protein
MLKGNTGCGEVLQCWWATDEFGELWCVKYDIIEEGYSQGVELRGINEGHNDLQVFANPFETQLCESGEDSACLGRQMSACPVRE